MAHRDSIETWYGWVIVIASLAIHSIGLGAPAILFVTLKPIAEDLGTVRAIPSMAYSLMMVGTGIGGIAMGWWMDRRGVMQPVMFGALMIAAGALLAGRADGALNLFVACGVLIGLLGKAAMIAPLVANVTRWFDRRRGLAVAILASGQGLSGAVWPPIVRYFNDAFGWRETFSYFGLFAVLTMLPLALLLRPRPPASPPQQQASPAANEKRVNGFSPPAVQGMLWLAVIGCCTGMAVPIVHLVSHATDLGFSAARGAELLSVLFGAAFFSRIAFGMLADRIGALPTMLIGSASQAVMLAAFAVVDSLDGLYVAALLFGIGFAGIMPCYPLIIRLLFPVRHLGWRIACQYLFAAMGMALGGWMGGVFFDFTGSYTHAFLAGLGFNLINLAVIATLFLRQGPAHPRPLAATG